VDLGGVALNGDLYLLGNRSGTGAAVWRTSVCPTASGNDWTTVRADAFEDSRNRDLPSHAEFLDLLYVGTRADETIGAEIWRTDGVTWTPSVGGNPTQMSPTPEGFGDPTNNERVRSLAIYQQQLYIGLGNGLLGTPSRGQIWSLPLGPGVPALSGAWLAISALTLAAVGVGRLRARS
jgi:hypothetical protein